jgi:hypothetical protein
MADMISENTTTMKMLHSELIDRATKKEFKDLEKKAIAFVEYDEFRRLEKSLENYVQKASLPAIQSSIKELQMKQDLCTTFEFVNIKLEETEFRLRNQLMGYQKTSDFSCFRQEHQEAIEKIQESN